MASLSADPLLPGDPPALSDRPQTKRDPVSSLQVLHET